MSHRPLIDCAHGVAAPFTAVYWPLCLLMSKSAVKNGGNCLWRFISFVAPTFSHAYIVHFPTLYPVFLVLAKKTWVKRFKSLCFVLPRSLGAWQRRRASVPSDVCLADAILVLESVSQIGKLRAIRYSSWAFGGVALASVCIKRAENHTRNIILYAVIIGLKPPKVSTGIPSTLQRQCNYCK